MQRIFQSLCTYEWRVNLNSNESKQKTTTYLAPKFREGRLLNRIKNSTWQALNVHIKRPTLLCPQLANS
jgi:hypothetical protein